MYDLGPTFNIQNSTFKIQNKTSAALKRPLCHFLPRSFFEVISRKNDGLLVKIQEGYRPNDVLRFFIDQNTNVNSFSEILPSLNDIFIRLVEGTSVSRQFQNINS